VTRRNRPNYYGDGVAIPGVLPVPRLPTQGHGGCGQPGLHRAGARVVRQSPPGGHAEGPPSPRLRRDKRGSPWWSFAPCPSRRAGPRSASSWRPTGRAGAGRAPALPRGFTSEHGGRAPKEWWNGLAPPPHTGPSYGLPPSSSRPGSSCVRCEIQACLSSQRPLCSKHGNHTIYRSRLQTEGARLHRQTLPGQELGNGRSNGARRCVGLFGVGRFSFHRRRSCHV
jgi:hypothetical protein